MRFRYHACGDLFRTNGIEKDRVHVAVGLVWGKERRTGVI